MTQPSHTDASGRTTVVPLIHLNGTMATDLLAAIDDARAATRLALSRVEAACPNGRDYPVPGAIRVALERHADAELRLNEVIRYLQALEAGVYQQLDARSTA